MEPEYGSGGDERLGRIYEVALSVNVDIGVYIWPLQFDVSKKNE